MHIISWHQVFVGLSCAFLRSMTVRGANVNECTVTRIAEVDGRTPKRNGGRGKERRAKRRPQATWPSPLYRRPRRWRHFGAHLDLRLVSRNLAPAHIPRSLRAVARIRRYGVSMLRLTSAPTCCSGLRSWPRRAISPPRETGTRVNEI